ncbi:cytochrome P450 [Sphingobium lactosutens]|nr:cytochrome P450 [Sphingobium lactosutens]
MHQDDWADGLPAIDDIIMGDLMEDPYPIYARAREMGSVVRIAATGLCLVTHFDDIIAIERDPETFSSRIPESNVVQLFGANLMRKDGHDHRRERQAIDPALRPGTAKRCWAPRLEAIVDDILNEVEPLGQADLFSAVAEPIAGRALIEVIGFVDLEWQTIARWSQAMMDGSSNYSQDSEPRLRALAAGREIERAVDLSLNQAGGPPEDSILGSMSRAGLSREEIHGNAKVAVGGGFNEPRDSLLSLLLGVLSDPVQRDRLLSDPALWPAAFDEAVRWISPIGMYPRKLTRDASIGGVTLPRGALIGLSVAAANREPERFVDPDRFDLSRPKVKNLAFGSGPHFCAGSWVARTLVGGIAGPRIFSRLSALRLVDSETVPVRGWVFRGPTSLPAQWTV